MILRLLKYTLIAVFSILSLCFITIGGFWFWLTTSSGQSWLNETITHQVKENSGYDLTYNDARFRSYKNFSLEKVTLADQDGIWLSAEQLNIEVNLDDLWKYNTIIVDDISLQSLYVIRQPLSPTSNQEEKTPESSATPIDPEAYSPNIDIKHLAIPHILLGKELTTQPHDIALNFKSHAYWNGHKKNAVINLSLVTKQSLIKGLSDSQLNLQAQYELIEQIFNIKQLLFKDNQQNLSSPGLTLNLSKNTVNGQIDIENLLIDPWVEDVKSSLSGHLKVNGQLTLPELDVNLLLKDTYYKENKIDNVTFNALITPKNNTLWQISSQLNAPFIGVKSNIDAQLKDNLKLTVDKADIHFPNSQLQAQMTCDLPCQFVDGRLTFDSKNLSDFGKHIDLDLQGMSHLVVDLDIHHNSQKKQLQSLKMTLDSQGIQSPWIHLEELSLDAHSTNLYGFRPDQLNLTILNAQIENYQVEQLKVETQKTSENTIQFQINSQGNVLEDYQTHIEGQVDTENFTLFNILLNEMDSTWGDIHAKLLEPSQFHHHLQTLETKWSLPGITLNDSLLSSEGRYTKDSVQSTLHLKDFKLKPLPIDIPEQLKHASASLNAQVSGHLEKPVIKAQVNLDDIHLQEGQPTVDFLAKASYKKERFEVEVSSQDRRLTKNEIKATLPAKLALSPFEHNITEHTPISGKIHLDSSIAPWVKTLETNGHHISGDLKGDLSIEGILSAPLIVGSLGFTGANYQNKPQGIDIRDISIELAFSENTISLTTLNAKDNDKGTVSGSGVLNYQLSEKKPLDYDFNLSLNKFSPLEQDTFTTTLDGQLKFVGNQHKGKVSGDVHLTPMHIQIPEQFEENIPELNFEDKKTTDGTQDQQKTTNEKNTYQVKLNVNLLAEQQVFVRGWGLDTEWGGKLKVKGQAENPSITGALSLKRGRYEDFNKKFRLEDGTLTFSGPIPPSPFIHLLASTTVDEYEIQPNFSGSVIKPKLDIKSVPTLPKDEAMSLLLFGKSSKEITPIQALQLASSLKRLAGYSSGKGFDPISSARDILHVDDITIKNDSDNPQATTVGVGKYISDKVYLQVEGGSEPGSGKAKLEIEVTDNISVDSSTSEDNQSSVGIKFKKDY